MHSSKRTASEIADEHWDKLVTRWFGDWCHCGGKGYWYEQIDGVKRRLVRCSKHWTGDPDANQD